MKKTKVFWKREREKINDDTVVYGKTTGYTEVRPRLWGRR